MPKSYVARPTGTSAIRLDLDAERHKALRVIAAEAGVPMSQFVRQLVEKEIDRRRRKSSK